MLRSAWRKLSVSLLLSLPLLLFGVSRLMAQAQATTGIIRGVVVDPNGAPVGGAGVSFHEMQTNFQRSVVVDAAGRFAAPLLPLGTYEVTARAIGFNPVTQKGIVLRVGQSVDLRLAVLPITLAAVNVEATQVLVDPTKTESADRLPVQAVAGLPNNGRNYLNLTLLTPNVAIVQGPDGDELTVAGQRGIHNNVSVDGADFNNSFFGEQRGGQRPAFTFNLDAVRELVVVAGGANAEFGRSSGGFVNVITKSGTNELHGSLHYFGKFDAISGSPSHTPAGGGSPVTFEPDFKQHQFGFTLGGPIKADRAFFFVAYDQQIYDDIKQKTRPPSAQLDSLTTFLSARYPELASDFGPIARTNNARAALAKLDFRLSARHNLSLKYNYTWAEQQNGTFDVDTWGASANGLEQSKSNAVNGSLISFLSSRASNEFRFQFAREDRPRPYNGPNNHLGDTTGVSSIFGSGVPFHDTDVDFGNAFRFGMPFFLPISDDHDTRIQLLDNVSLTRGNHLFKFGGEWNRTSTTQVFVGFAAGRMAFGSVTGFINFVNQGSHYIECSDGTSGVAPGFSCAGGSDHHRPGHPVSAAIGGGVDDRRAGGHADAHRQRVRTLSPGYLEADAQADGELRLALGGADPAQRDYPALHSVLLTVDRFDGQRAYLPVRWHDPVGQEDVPAASRSRVGSAGGWAAGVPPQRRGLLCAHSGSESGERAQHQRVARSDAVRVERDGGIPAAAGVRQPVALEHGHAVPTGRVRGGSQLQEPADH